MKKRDLQPTIKNIKETFINDSIGRNKDLLYFIRIINSLEENYSIALDSYWGSGKTFFVKQVKMILEANNDWAYSTVDDKEEILKKWTQLTKENSIALKPHVPIYYDAWENDSDDDPIYSLMYQILSETNNADALKERINYKDVIATFGKIAGAFSGTNPAEIANNLQKGDFLDFLREKRSIHERIVEFIDSLLPEHGDRLLIIIDELDRCNPEFAVKLLERIKHYFNNDKVTFVFSVNLVELQHTIKHHYGSDFDASRYLDRFFDFRVSLPSPDMNKYLAYYSIYSRNYVFDDSMKIVIKKFNLQLREISRYIQLSKSVVSTLAYNSHLSLSNTRNFLVQVIVPVSIGLMLTDNIRYHKFINGEDNSVLKEFYNDIESISNVEHYLNWLFNDGQIPDYNYASRDIGDITLLHKQLDAFYISFFQRTDELIIGSCAIRKHERDYFQRIISLLSENSIKNLEEKQEELM